MFSAPNFASDHGEGTRPPPGSSFSAKRSHRVDSCSTRGGH